MLASSINPKILRVAIVLDSTLAIRIKSWWAVAESNCGHEAFQASALPTELTARMIKFRVKGYKLNLKCTLAQFTFNF